MRFAAEGKSNDTEPLRANQLGDLARCLLERVPDLPTGFAQELTDEPQSKAMLLVRCAHQENVPFVVDGNRTSLYSECGQEELKAC